MKRGTRDGNCASLRSLSVRWLVLGSTIPWYFRSDRGCKGSPYARVSSASNCTKILAHYRNSGVCAHQLVVPSGVLHEEVSIAYDHANNTSCRHGQQRRQKRTVGDEDETHAVARMHTTGALRFSFPRGGVAQLGEFQSTWYISRQLKTNHRQGCDRNTARNTAHANSHLTKIVAQSATRRAITSQSPCCTVKTAFQGCGQGLHGSRASIP